MRIVKLYTSAYCNSLPICPSVICFAVQYLVEEALTTLVATEERLLQRQLGGCTFVTSENYLSLHIVS